MAFGAGLIRVILIELCRKGDSVDYLADRTGENTKAPYRETWHIAHSHIPRARIVGCSPERKALSNSPPYYLLARTDWAEDGPNLEHPFDFSVDTLASLWGLGTFISSRINSGNSKVVCISRGEILYLVAGHRSHMRGWVIVPRRHAHINIVSR